MNKKVRDLEAGMRGKGASVSDAKAAYVQALIDHYRHRPKKKDKKRKGKV